MAACNAGSLNYLKVKADNTWAWPPMMFDNAVEKVQDYLDVMKDADTIPEFECFDVGIVRCVGMYRQTGMYSGPLEYNFVMGVASGMPADPELLPILLKLKLPEAHWQVTAIGRAEIWPLHQRCADLGGHLRTGLEDTFYLGRRHQGDIERAADRGHRGLRAPRRPRDREPGGSAADFRDQALVLSLRAKRAIHRASVGSHRMHLGRVPRNDGCRQRISPGMTHKGWNEHDQSNCNRRRTRSGPHRPGGDRRSPQARGGALSRSDRAHRRRAARDFTELERDANRFANYLVQRGLKPGEKISTICNNSVEFVKALFGIHRAGLVWVPINTMLGPADMDYILGHAEVRFALIDDNLHAQAERRAALEKRGMRDDRGRSGRQRRRDGAGEFQRSASRASPTSSPRSRSTTAISR